MKDAGIVSRALALGQGFAQSAFIANTFFYALASYSRWSREWKTPNYSEPIEEILQEEKVRIWRGYWECAGIILGFPAGYLAQVLVYSTLVEQGHWYSLALPLLTNAASYLYERHRTGSTSGQNPHSIDDTVKA